MYKAINTSHTPLESRQYSPYGEPTQISGSSQSAYGFTGEPTDSNGFLYLRARYLRPELGQFLSLDAVEQGNRYSYVGGNPVNRVDPSGMVIMCSPSTHQIRCSRQKPDIGGICFWCSLSTLFNCPCPCAVRR